MIDNRDPYDLMTVVMPLIRLMRDAHMSWMQRTDIAWAIQECLRNHALLMEEHNKVSSENSSEIEIKKK